MLKIEQFIERNFGIKLLPHQLEYIAALAAGNQMAGAKASGKTTARKAAMAYLQDGLKQVDFDAGTKIDFGELLLETAKNAEHLTPNMQNLIAKYMDYQSAPKIVMSGKFDPDDLKRRTPII